MWHSPCTKKNPVNMSPHFPMCLLLGFPRIVVILFLVVGTQCESLCYSYLLPHSLPPKVESKPLSGALEEESGNKNSVLSSLLHLEVSCSWIASVLNLCVLSFLVGELHMVGGRREGYWLSRWGCGHVVKSVWIRGSGLEAHSFCS